MLTRINQDLNVEISELKWTKRERQEDIIIEEPVDNLEEEKLKWEKERQSLLDEIEKWEDIYVQKLALREE